MKLAWALLALASIACGRSSPDPCRAREGLACGPLADERALEQADYDAALAVLDAEAAALQGACVQSLVGEQLEKRCIDDPCVELCTLHPCAVRDAAGEPSVDDCVTRCNEEVAENELARADLDAAILRAANEPTLCTCGICDDATIALCEQLWVCSP